MPTRLAIPRAPNGTMPIHTTVISVESRLSLATPISRATKQQSGVIKTHNTTFLAANRRRKSTGSPRARRTLTASGPSTFVAGTSEYIHEASTPAKTSEPWREKTSSLSDGGRKNQAELIRAPLTATTTGIS